MNHKLIRTHYRYETANQWEKERFEGMKVVFEKAATGCRGYRGMAVAINKGPVTVGPDPESPDGIQYDLQEKFETRRDPFVLLDEIQRDGVHADLLPFFGNQTKLAESIIFKLLTNMDPANHAVMLINTAAAWAITLMTEDSPGVYTAQIEHNFYGGDVLFEYIDDTGVFDHLLTGASS